MMNKFEAAKRFDAGLRHALFRDPRPKGVDWNTCKLFNEGWKYGNYLKSAYIAARNTVLHENGYERIGVVRLADGNEREPRGES